MSVEKAINGSVYRERTYPELCEGFLPAAHILLTKTCTDTWPEVVDLQIVYPSKGKNTKQEYKQKPKPYFKKFGMGHQKLLHLVAKEITQHV